MVEIATKITQFNATTKESNYNIPYSVIRSTKMSNHIRQLSTQKPRKRNYEKHLAFITDTQIKETNYAFYNPWDYKQASPDWELSNKPMNMRANALAPFKSMAQYNHPLYQSYQKDNNNNAFTKHGFMCVQFIVWLAQCAMIELRPEFDELTDKVKKSKTQEIKDIATLSRKYTKTDDPNKWHIKRLLLFGSRQKKLPSEEEYKSLFSWLDYDGKMMAPGTLLKIFMDQSEICGGGGGDGKKPFIVDYYHVNNNENGQTQNILDEISDLVNTINQLNLKHAIPFNVNQYILNFFLKIVFALAENPNRLQSLLLGDSRQRQNTFLRNRHVNVVARQTHALSLFTSESREPIQSKPSHHSFTEVQYLGEATNAIMSIFLNKLKVTISSSKKASHKRKPDPAPSFRPKKNSRSI